MLYNKKIAVINDFCGFGRCSIAVQLPIISSLKIQCCPMPTSIFSNHTGYDSFYYTDFTKHMISYIDEWKKLNLKFNAVLTGFLASTQQIEIVKYFFNSLENTIKIVDPVMGDNGNLYPTYSNDLAQKMKELICFADILTPNLTEACILTDTKYNKNISNDELTLICDKLSSINPKKIVISGIERDEHIENFIYEQGKNYQIIKENKIYGCRSGTGDVFSSIIAADIVNSIDFDLSVRHASAFIAKCLKTTNELNIPSTDGICFENHLYEIGDVKP